ncbi:DNA cytosine methyltransferase, partial [Limosilactobacillus reuteri]
AFLKSVFGNDALDYKYPKGQVLEHSVFDLLDKDVSPKYFLSKKILPTILADGSGNYHSKSEIDLPVARPLTATMHKMHRANQDNYYHDIKNRKKFQEDPKRPISDVRRFTPNECRKLQGFPSDWKFVVSDTQLYREFGNAVSVNVSYAVAQSINKFLREIGYVG